MKRPTKPPRMTNEVALGIKILATSSGVRTAIAEGTSHPNAAPDVGPDDVKRARKAIAYADEWQAWHVADVKRQAKALRARARKMLAGGAS